jgi:hypothetical protein
MKRRKSHTSQMVKLAKQRQELEWFLVDNPAEGA